MAAPEARPATRARPRPTRCAPAPPRAAPGAWPPARPGALPRPPRLSARTELFSRQIFFFVELGCGSDICPASGRRLPRPAMLMKYSTHGVSRHWRSPWLTPGGRWRPRGLVLKSGTHSEPVTGCVTHARRAAPASCPGRKRWRARPPGVPAGSYSTWPHGARPAPPYRPRAPRRLPRACSLAAAAPCTSAEHAASGNFFSSAAARWRTCGAAPPMSDSCMRMPSARTYWAAPPRAGAPAHAIPQTAPALPIIRVLTRSFAYMQASTP